MFKYKFDDLLEALVVMKILSTIPGILEKFVNSPNKLWAFRNLDEKSMNLIYGYVNIILMTEVSVRDLQSLYFTPSASDLVNFTEEEIFRYDFVKQFCCAHSLGDELIACAEAALSLLPHNQKEQALQNFSELELSLRQKYSSILTA